MLSSHWMRPWSPWWLVAVGRTCLLWVSSVKHSRCPSHQDLRCHNSKISWIIKFSTPCKMHILRCMGSKFRVKFQWAPLKFHTKSWTHTRQNVHFTVFNFCVWVTISLNCDVIGLSETVHRSLYSLSGRMSYRKISWTKSRFGFRLFQSLWNLTGISVTPLPRCLSNIRAIWSL